MRKAIFLANLMAIPIVFGMQNNFIDNNLDLSINPLTPIRAENFQLSENYKTLTIREWITRIINMPRNKKDFNAPQNLEGQTILMCATKYSDCRIMKQVLNSKDALGNRLIDINAKDINGNTALSIALEADSMEKVKLLLQCDANVEIAKKKVSKKACKKLETIHRQVQFAHKKLLAAICSGIYQEVKSLLENTSININAKDEDSLSALLVATAYNHDKIVELLLQQPNIDVNIQNNDKLTALMIAVQCGYKEIVKLLLQHPNIKVNAPNRHGFTALMYATTKENQEIIKLLLKHPNIDINLQEEEGVNALMLSEASGNKEIVKLFLKHPNINVNLKSNGGLTVLMFAAVDRHKEIFNLLLEHPNIDINIKDNHGFTALIRATLSDNKETVDLLLKKGIDINQKYFNGSSALMFAIEAGNAGIVNLLLNHPDLDINAQNDEGETALDCALRKGRRRIIKLIQAKMGILCQPFNSFNNESNGSNRLSPDGIYQKFWKAVSQGDINEIDLLLSDDRKNLSDINTKNEDGDTALIVASDKGNLEVIRLLFEYGADLSIKDAHGNNALIRAAQKGHIDVVNELLFRKANINSTGQHKKTALMWATKNGHIRVVKLLLKNGAKVSIKNSYDKTALDIVNEKIKKLGNTNNLYDSIKCSLEKYLKLSNLPLDNKVRIEASFNKWDVVTNKDFDKELKNWEKNDPVIYNKILQLIEDIKLDPFRGLGQVEALKGDLEGSYSRRITLQDRLVYEIDGEKVILTSCKGHYEKNKRK